MNSRRFADAKTSNVATTVVLLSQDAVVLLTTPLAKRKKTSQKRCLFSWWERVDSNLVGCFASFYSLFHYAHKLAVVLLTTPSDKEKRPTEWLVSFLGGRGWIRTTEGEASRFTVCPLWPLGNSPKSNDSHYTTAKPLCQG